MNRLERLKKSIDYLMNNGYIHVQTDIAKKMDSHPQPVSRACNGDERYLTDKFLGRYNSAFENIFDIEWLKTGKGDMLSTAPHTQNVVNSQNTVQNNSTMSIGNKELEKELIEMLKRKDEQIDRKDEQIKEQSQQISRKDEQINALLKLLGERK